MSRRGPYETPAAWVAGRWFFAQDRPQQIADWLDQLGWSASLCCRPGLESGARRSTRPLTRGCDR